MSKQQLLKTPSLVAYVINSILGYGIWTLPKYLLQRTSSLFVSYLSILVCTIISLIFSICYAELGTIFPVGFGEPTYYNYFYGKISATIYSCVSVGIIIPLCMITSTSYVIDPIRGNKIINRLILLIILTVLNSFKLWWSLRIQEILTYIKILMTAFVPIFAVLLKIGVIKTKECTSLNAFNRPELLKGVFEANNKGSGFKENFLSVIILLPIIINAYDGLNSANFITNRVYRPQKTFKRALPLSIILISVLYLIVITSVFYVVPLQNILNLTDENNNANALTLFFEQFVFFKYSGYFLLIMSSFSNMATLNGLFILTIFLTESLTGEYYQLLSAVIVCAVYLIGFLDCDFCKYLSLITTNIYIWYFLTMIILTYLCFKRKIIHMSDDMGNKYKTVSRLNWFWPILAAFCSGTIFIFSLYSIIG